MTGTRAWSKHFRDVWQERAGDSNLPAWLRVASLALGTHKANGHAVFRRGSRSYAGDIAVTLATVDTTTGEVRPALAETVRDAVDTAVRYGWLATGSNTACLIVPGHAVTFDIGNPLAACPVDHEAARARHHRQRRPEIVPAERAS